MKSLYTGPSGRRFTKDQLKAIHAGRFDSASKWYLNRVPEHVSLAIAKKNKFVLPAVVAGAGVVIPGTVAMPGAIGQLQSQPRQSSVQQRQSSVQQKPAVERLVGWTADKALDVGTPVAGISAAIAGEEAGNFLEGLSELGQPRVLSNTELIMEKYGANFYSMGRRGCTDDYDLDVDKLRKVLKKQYPGADVDAKIKLLPEDKYMNVALKDNPGREKEAFMSNGFYSPVKDTAYLEKGDKLNTVRALIHELVHDMANEGVEDYMLNEGYADYVAYNIMTEELGVPRNVARSTIGYPDDLKRVDRLVRKYGRENVDRAFLKEHTLSYLDSKTPLLALNT